MAIGKQRLDTLLAERGLFPSRSRAAASVMAGEVRVGAEERRAAKPGEMVDVAERVRVIEHPQFVSRGGIKLANALASTGLEVRGRRALDVGASTGGFTDCLLQRGAREVIAVDVGYGSLAWSLRSDPRVSVLERINARALSPQLLPAPRAGPPGPPGLATIDAKGLATLGAVSAGPSLTIRAADAEITGVQRAGTVTFQNNAAATSAMRIGEGVATDGFRLSNTEIARTRGTSARTVANQVASLFRKLGIRSRAEAVAALATLQRS